MFFYLLQLASEMLRLFDPTMDPQTTPAEETLNLIPIYRNPKIQGGTLPGKSFSMTSQRTTGTYSNDFT